MDRILVDTGPIVAILDEHDQHHLACIEQAHNLPESVYTYWPVITEAVYLLRHRADLVEKLLETVADGIYELLPLTAADVPGIGGIHAKYQDQGVDLADACLLYLAGREKVSTVFTVDERHFSIFRTAAGQPLDLVPPLSSTD